MLEKIKDKLNEVIAIAETCPDKYQVKCFEVLLSSLVRAEAEVPIKGDAITTSQAGDKAAPAFFARQNITEEEWQKVFHFDGTTYSIIVDDLKETTRSKKQVKLALLDGIKELLTSGIATVIKDDLIESCKKYDAYDSPNFATHMKRQKSFFLAKGDNWSLTKPGEKRAGEVIKELAQ
jgi:hypothetical protein